LQTLRNSVEDKYFANDIDTTTYKNTLARYDRKIIEINGKIAEMNLSFSGYS